MNIAYLTSSTIPSRTANSVHVMKMAQAFVAHSHRVTLLAPSNPAVEPSIRDPYSFYGVEPIFEIKKLPWRNVPGRGWLYGLELARAAKALSPDLVYGRSLRGCAFASLLGLPTVFEAHSLTPLLRSKDSQVFRLMISRPNFKYLVVISEGLAGDVCAHFPQLRGRICIAHDGADPVPPRCVPAKLNVNSARLQVGYVGQLYPGKGFELIAKLARVAMWADFHVVGGDQSRIDALLASGELPANLYLHGFKPPAEAECFRLACDVLLAPYSARVEAAGGGDIARWTSPLKLFEYMAAGKSILCSDLPVLKEILVHEKTALLCKPDSESEWLYALLRLRDDPVLRKGLAQQAREEFLARHTWRQRAVKVLLQPESA